MKKYILFIILVFSSSAGISAVMAQQGHGKGRMMMKQGEHGFPMEQCFRSRDYLISTLKFTGEQIEKIEKINSDFRDKLESSLEKIRPLQRELKTVMLADDIDLVKARALLVEISKIEVEIRMLKLGHRAEIEKVMTDEQKKQFRSEKKGMCGRGN